MRAKLAKVDEGYEFSSGKQYLQVALAFAIVSGLAACGGNLCTIAYNNVVAVNAIMSALVLGIGVAMLGAVVGSFLLFLIDCAGLEEYVKSRVRASE